MTRAGGGRLALAALAGLGLLCAIFAVRVARHERGGRLELGRFKLTQVEPASRQRLQAARDRVIVTYYASPAERMPSDMRRLERDVTDVLAALARAAPDRFDYQIVDPTRDPDIERYASRQRVSPIRVRSVERDGYREKTVWSSLTVACGSLPPAVIQGLLPEHLPRLQALLVAQLDQMEAPRRPVIALCAPPGSELLAQALAQRGELLRVDLEAGEPFPAEADLLFWLDPRASTPTLLRELELFLQRGRSAVLAGRAHALASARHAPGPEAGAVFEIAAQPSAMPELLAPFGLGTVPGIVCDGLSQMVRDGQALLPAPFVLRCIAPNQDFRSFHGQPNGHLVFELPSPLLLHGEKLESRGLRADVLASSSDDTWIVPARPAPYRLDDLSRERGESAPRQPLMVCLRPAEAWQGLLVACAASTPFTDAALDLPDTAHRELLAVLLDTLAGNDRLVQARLGLQRPAPLPELSATTRGVWRGLCVFLFPVGLLLVALRRRGRQSPPGGPRAGRPRWQQQLLLRAFAGAAAIVVVGGLARESPLRQDLTDEHLNQLAPHTRVLAASSRGEHAVSAELFFSERDRLPPALRPGIARLRHLLAELRRQGGEIRVTNVHPEDLPPDERDRLAAAGLAPVGISTRDEDLTTVRSVWCSLRLSGSGRSTVLRFPSAAAFESLQFRLAFALWRLQTGEQPHIGFASDVPRLSAAEAHEHYQKLGLFAPAGADVYSLARQSLLDSDFLITHVNPRAPVLPEDLDALVWLQPRRPVERMLQATLLHLRRGGGVLLAAQHFVMQPRVYPGSSMELRWWPQPQLPDLERLYFPDLGVELVRAPLFDELHTSALLTASVASGDARAVQPVQAALPFLVRAAASNFTAASPLTAHLGDQALLFPSFFRLDGPRLAAAGLSAHPLITSSDHAWSMAWLGGPLPPEILQGPPADEHGQPRWESALPLAVELQGTFPLPEQRLVPADGASAAEGTPLDPWPPREMAPPRPARLVFLAGSELFKNHRLLEPAFRADHLLLNAAASLALPPELAEVASRRPVVRGFGWVSSEARLGWRAGVLGSFPAAALLVALVWRLLRRRSAAGAAR